MTWTAEQERVRQQLITSVSAWRAAVCSDNGCDGDNHAMECPVELARQDILASHNKVELLKAL